MTILDPTAHPQPDEVLNSAPSGGGGVSPQRTTVPTACHLLWDLPNMTATLGKVIGCSASKKTRYEFGALAAYLVMTAGDELTPAGTIFMNVPRDQVAGLQRLATMFRSCGFGVYARPKIANSDIDDNVIAHVEAHSAEISHLLLGTHDKALIERTIAALDPTCRISVLGFEEQSSFAIGADRVQFVDVEDIDGMFSAPLARALFSRLPDQGAYLRPLGPLKGAKRAA